MLFKKLFIVLEMLDRQPFRQQAQRLCGNADRTRGDLCARLHPSFGQNEGDYDKLQLHYAMPDLEWLVNARKVSFSSISLFRGFFIFCYSRDDVVLTKLFFIFFISSFPFPNMYLRRGMVKPLSVKLSASKQLAES